MDLGPLANPEMSGFHSMTKSWDFRDYSLQYTVNYVCCPISYCNPLYQYI